MASNDVQRSGIGNQSDNLGRYYMSHLFGAIAVARLRDNSKAFICDFEKDPQGVYCRRRFWITPRAQREHKALNAIAYFVRPPLSDFQHRSALFSVIFMAKVVAKALRQGGVGRASAFVQERRATLMEHFKNVVRGVPALVPDLIRISRARYLARRRLPIVLPPKTTNHYYLFYNTEHAPHPESRLTLHESARDALGMPRLVADIRFHDQDMETVLVAHRLIRLQFENTRTGELIYRE